MLSGGLGSGGFDSNRAARAEFCGNGPGLYLGCAGDYTTVFVKTHITVCFKRLNFIVGKFYPNKTVLNGVLSCLNDDTDMNLLTGKKVHVETFVSGVWVASDRNPHP